MSNQKSNQKGWVIVSTVDVQSCGIASIRQWVSRACGAITMPNICADSGCPEHAERSPCPIFVGVQRLRAIFVGVQRLRTHPEAANPEAAQSGRPHRLDKTYRLTPHLLDTPIRSATYIVKRSTECAADKPGREGVQLLRT
jgi:hypothetical protein